MQTRKVAMEEEEEEDLQDARVPRPALPARRPRSAEATAAWLAPSSPP